MRAPAHLAADRLDDRGMGMAGDRGAVAAVHVDILGAVDVIHLRPGAVAHPHRLRLRDLPVRRRAAGKVLARPSDHLGAARLACQEHLLLVGDQVVDRVLNRALDNRRTHGEPPLECCADLRRSAAPAID